VRDRNNEPFVVAGSALGRLTVWSVATGERKDEKEKRADSRPITQLAFSKEQHLLAAADDQGTITLWQTDSWDMWRLSPKDKPQLVGLLGFGRNGSVLVSAAGVDKLTLWDLDVVSLGKKVCDILRVRHGSICKGAP
jgi:WD40 repeat protein